MVPDGWAVTHLKSIVDGPIKNGYSPVASKTETGYWVLSLGALSDNGLIPCAVKPVDPEKNVLQSILSAGDFLLSRSNTPDKVGRSVRFRGEISNCSYPDLMMRFRVDRKLVNECFIEQKLKSHQIRSYYQSHAAGSSGTMVKINKATVEKTPLLLPPLWEQSRIAKILSTWDHAIETTEKLIENSKAQKKALMQQLLTGKKRLPGFSGEWHNFHLRELLVEVRIKNRDDKISRVLSVSNKRGFILPEEQFSKRVASDNVSNYLIVRRGQYAFNPSRMNVGSFARLEKFGEGLVSPMYVVFSVDMACLDNDFFKNWMQSHAARGRIGNLTQGSVRESVSFDALGSLPISLPTLDEQRSISVRLAACDKEAELLNSDLLNLRDEKKALMQQLLTGKRRVKVTA